MVVLELYSRETKESSDAIFSFESPAKFKLRLCVPNDHSGHSLDANLQLQSNTKSKRAVTSPYALILPVKWLFPCAFVPAPTSRAAVPRTPTVAMPLIPTPASAETLRVIVIAPLGPMSKTAISSYEI